jgi:hypothetical protein
MFGLLELYIMRPVPTLNFIKYLNNLKYAIFIYFTFSDSVSNAEVASSKINIFGSLKIARAIAIRCFWPPDNCVPLGPTFVSYFFTF